MTDSKDFWTKAAFVAAFLLGYFGMAFLPAMGFKAADPTILETTKTIMTLIAGYYFGSSSGSAAKDKTIAEQAAK